MGLWIAIFITFAVLGSILWVKPSPREKMLTNYRKQALGLGLKVRLLDQKLSAQLFPWLADHRSFVFYECSIPVHAKPQSNKPIVIRLKDDPNAHELDSKDAVKEALSEKIDFSRLPNTSEAIVVSASGIALLWKEVSGEKVAGDFVAEIAKFLEECLSHHKLWQ